MKDDFGFYGKGLDGYVHYKQSVDRIGGGNSSGGSSHKLTLKERKEILDKELDKINEEYKKNPPKELTFWGKIGAYSLFVLTIATPIIWLIVIILYIIKN